MLILLSSPFITMVVFCLFCGHIKFIPSTGALHVLCLLPGMPFPQMFTLFRCQLKKTLREASPYHPLASHSITLHPIAQSDILSVYFKLVVQYT